MKKLFLVATAILVALLTFIFFVAGCKKEESIYPHNPNNSENVMIPKIYSDENPFDKNYEYIKEMMQDVVIFLSDLKENGCSDFSVFIEKLGPVIEKHINCPYPQLNYVSFNSNLRTFTPEQKKMMNLTANYMSDIGTMGLLEASVETERTIASIQDEILQQDMYNIVSQIKFSYYYLIEELILEGIILLDPDFATPWELCVHEHFENMTWIDWIQWGLNPPVYTAFVFANCAWKTKNGSANS
jgi:hypothetical protein